MRHIDTPLRQLKTIQLFDDLPEEQLAVLAGATWEKRFAKDELIFQKGDLPTGLLVVLAGTVKTACQSPEGGEKILDLLGPGQVFGEAALFLDCPYPYLAAALASARILHVDGRALLDLIDRSPDFSRRMLLQLSVRVYDITRDIENYTLRAPVERVAGFLLDHCAASAQAAPVVAFPAPKHVFASRLGMTPESLSRSMRDLADAGLIEVHRNRITVLDPERLEEHFG